MTEPEPSLRELLGRSSLAGLPPEPLQPIIRDATRVRAPAGSIVIREGDAPAVHLIASGLVRVFLTAPSGRQATVRYVRTGNLMGTATLFSGAHRPSVQAITDSVFYALSVPRLTRLAESDVLVANALCREMASRLRDYFGVLAVAHFGTLRQRVASHLLNMAAESQRGASLVASVTQQELADAAGSVREVVARVMQALKKEGLVATGKRGIRLLDPIRLQAETVWPEE